MSRTTKPTRTKLYAANIKRSGHGYVTNNKPSAQTLRMVITFECGKIPTHSIRRGKHCPCCLLGEWGKRLKQRTNRAVRRKVKRSINDDSITYSYNVYED